MIAVRTAFAILFAAVATVCAQGGETKVQLSADGASDLTVYLPEGTAAPCAAIVICPGGGYKMLCDSYEGHDMAKWLVARGIAGAVLRYRLAPTYHKTEMMADVSAAFRTVRRHAAAWRIDPKRVGVLGFSAGGHLAAMAGLRPGDDRADFMALVYPHASMQTGLGSERMRQAFLGPNYSAADVDAYSAEKLVGEKLPKTFVVHARTDEICPVEHSRRLAAAMREKGGAVTYHELPSGRHGLGCGKGDDWSTWLNLFDGWLRRNALCRP